MINHGAPGQLPPLVASRRDLLLLLLHLLFLKIVKGTCLQKKHNNRANLASGRRGIDRSRREDSDSINESSVAALGASLVTKQAGRVPQHD